MNVGNRPRRPGPTMMESRSSEGPRLWYDAGYRAGLAKRATRGVTRRLWAATSFESQRVFWVKLILSHSAWEGGLCMSVIKVIELVGTSTEGWEDAVSEAVKEASKTIRNISGVEVLNWTGAVDGSGQITEYKADVQIAFRVDNT